MVAQLPVLLFRELLERRLVDHSRLFDRCCIMALDGSVKEKCRQGFAEVGKSSTGTGRYRYVLQLSVIGSQGTLLLLMHEEMDVINPETQKEECELKAFERLAQRLKKEFPKLAICLVADSLYCCQAMVTIVQLFDWKYVLTLKEGRQPTTWDEAIRLLPLNGRKSSFILEPADGVRHIVSCQGPWNVDLRTPPGPEGSNGSLLCVCRGHPGFSI